MPLCTYIGIFMCVCVFTCRIIFPSLTHRDVRNQSQSTGSFKLLSSIQCLSVSLTGSSEEGSDGQMRARSQSLPQRQQRQSCVLLPTSHRLPLPSSLQPIKHGRYLIQELHCLHAAESL